MQFFSKIAEPNARKRNWYRQGINSRPDRQHGEKQSRTLSKFQLSLTGLGCTYSSQRIKSNQEVLHTYCGNDLTDILFKRFSKGIHLVQLMNLQKMKWNALKLKKLWYFVILTCRLYKFHFTYHRRCYLFLKKILSLDWCMLKRFFKDPMWVLRLKCDWETKQLKKL